jgi:hypothetical protein
MPTFADTGAGRSRVFTRLRPGRLSSLVGLTATFAAGASPAWAHGTDSAAVTTSIWHASLRCIILLTTAVVAGSALLRLVLPVPTARGHRLLVGVAAVAALGDLLAVPVYGALPALSAAQAAATLACVQARGSRAASVSLGASVVMLVAWEAAAGHGPVGLVAAMLHTAAACIWIAATYRVATSGAAWRSTMRRSAAPAVLASAVVAASGVAQARLDHLSLSASGWRSLFGTLVLVKAAALVGAVGLALASRRRIANGGMRLEAVLLSVAVVLGASLAVVPTPALAPEMGRPLLRVVSFDRQALRVFVSPQRPGWNVVQVDVPARVGLGGSRLTSTRSLPGVNGQWARVWLSEGRNSLTVQRGDTRVQLPLDAGYQPALAAFGSADAAECAEVSRALLARGSDAPLLSCPSEALRPDDLEALTRTVEFLHARGVRSLRLVGDQSARSLAARQHVLTIARANAVTVDRPGANAELVVSGWSAAAAELDALRGRQAPVFGVYLAPWLLTAPLISRASSVATLTPLPFDPQGPAATTYATRLARLWPGATPTPSGFAAYEGGPSAGDIRLYAAALVSVLPTSLGHAHGGASTWLPGGAITAVSPPLAAA